MRKHNLLARAALSAVATVAFAGSAQAALINGSAGRINLIGNDASAATGSFSVDIAFQLYDGTSAADPMGITPGEYQVALVVKHNGSGGENPAQAFGRLSLFAPDVNAPLAFYTGNGSVNPGASGQWLVGPSGNQLDAFGGIAPSSVDIDPPPVASANRAEWFFETGLQQANFLPSQQSRLLVAKAPSSGFPSSVVIEVDRTNTNPSFDADTIIHFTPEPATALLGLVGAAALARRRMA